MSDYPKLSKAPIILAILEIQFKSPTSVTMKKLSWLQEVFKKEFPNQVIRNTAEFNYDPAQDDSTPIAVKRTADAYVFATNPRKHEFVISASTFTFYQHGEYNDWADFKRIALQTWQQCSDHIKPEKTGRLSIRYVNNIDIPYPISSKQEQKVIFNTYIAYIGKMNERSISNYFLKYTHFLDDEKLTIHFAQELKLGTSKSFPFIIDIDVLYASSDLMSSNEIADKYDELRIVKNEYFFSNLTESTFNLIS